jgi:tRNA nucleotidyltransferase (CCA-adding enzyme)
MNYSSKIPEKVLGTLKKLHDAGHEGYLVGGCVRDLMIGREPKDWDITTNAIPEEIIAIYEKTFYENAYGTVGVVVGEPEEAMVIEITPYRTESEYSDKRRPDSVKYSQSVLDDLKRRDFTMNAVAFNPFLNEFVDPYNGSKDIKDKIVRAVGNPKDRFEEDGLRILRAVRLSTVLGFVIDKETESDLIGSHETLSFIAKERIRDEFVKMIMSDSPMAGVFMCQRYGILKYIVPELEEGLHMKQNQAHSFGVFEHLLRSLQCSADKKYKLEIRLSALFHDIGKPRSRRFSAEKNDYTFYGHEVIGAKMAEEIMNRLHFPNKTTELVVKFVRWHMFFSDTEQITLSAVRRMVNNVGKENIWDLMNLRICDRVGTGRPKENPYRLRKYTSMIEQVMKDPITVGMLKVDGNDLMSEVKVPAGRKIGLILKALMEEVLEDPTKNTSDYLLNRASELNSGDETLLVKLADNGEKARQAKENEELNKINKKYSVK